MKFLGNAQLALAVLASNAWGTAVGEPEVKNVAIIGAGPAGSSAAYHLQKYAQEQGIAVNITVFEKTDRIGGRTLTVPAYNDLTQPIELGASIFVKINQIMYNSTLLFDLPTSEPHRLEDDDVTAIWDGKEFVYETKEGTWWLWDTVKLFWKYGMSPYRAVKLVNEVVQRFSCLYSPPYFPFASLTKTAEDLNLLKVTGMTGEQMLAENNIDAKFAREIWQAATRVNYASNLAYIHGLETMVSMATQGALAVDTGNWRIFEQMILTSGVTLHRNTAVTSIELQKTGKSSPAKYLISTQDASFTGDAISQYDISFDKVIVANPWQYSGIEAGEGVLHQKIDEIPYTHLHVTLFTSPLKLQPEFFGLAPGSKAPSSVYTTLAEDEEPKVGADGVGSTGFYSISTLKSVVNPNTSKRERVYKIFSTKPVTASFLTKLLGAQIPDDFVSQDKEADKETFQPISWYYPHSFHSYPIVLPRVTFQDPIVGDGLFYTSGIESFISTMETSALMGKNVARLVADEIIRDGLKKHVPVSEYKHAGKGKEKGAQVVISKKDGQKGETEEL